MGRSGRNRAGKTPAHTVSKGLSGLLLASAMLVLPLTEADAKFPPEPGADPGCTVAAPAARVTLELVASHSADLCPMLARAVGMDVLNARTGTSPSLWHYADATRSCRLHLSGKPRPTITVYNSGKVCRWLIKANWFPRVGPVVRT